MRKLFFLAGFSSALLFTPQAIAADFGVGANAGTPGIGVEAKLAVSKNVVVRGSYNFLDYEIDETFDDIDYSGDLNLSNFGGFIDFHPFESGLNISAGAFIGDKSVDLTATPNTSVEIGGQLFTAQEVGTLEGVVEIADFAPYLGLGYDSFIKGKDWSFNVRLGVMFTGEPEATLISTGGTLSSDPILQNEIEAEIQALEDDASDFKYYPVLSVGIAKRF